MPLGGLICWKNVTQMTFSTFTGKRGTATAARNPQLARGAGCCQMLLHLKTLHSHCMSLADWVFSFNSYSGAKCTKYLRQALLLTLIIHHWFCYCSTPKRGHSDSDPRRPVKECTNHSTSRHKLMSQAYPRRVWSKDLACWLQSPPRANGRRARVGCIHLSV